MKIRSLIVLFCCISSFGFAQQYNGVNVNRIKGKKYKGKQDKESVSYHTFGFGTNLPRSMNLESDNFWLENHSKSHQALSSPSWELTWNFHKNRWKFGVQVLYENFNGCDHERSEYDYYEEVNFNQWTGLVRVAYRWYNNERWNFYSGIGVGYAQESMHKLRGTEVKSNFVYTLPHQFNKIAYHATLAEAHFKIIDNFGAYAELGYGSKGLFSIGLQYILK